MTDVLIPYGDDAGQTAGDLLAAAEKAGFDPVFAVKHQPDDGGFRVPEEVAAAAGLDEPDEPETNEAEDQPKPKPRKRAAKKTASKE